MMRDEDVGRLLTQTWRDGHPVNDTAAECLGFIIKQRQERWLTSLWAGSEGDARIDDPTTVSSATTLTLKDFGIDQKRGREFLAWWEKK